MENKEDYNINVPMELEKVPKGKIRVLSKEVGKAPQIKIIKNTLEEKQKLVDGLIEVVPIYDIEDVLLVCNDEGKLDNLKPNIILDYDYIVGDCFFIGDNYKNADFKSLTREQIIGICEMLNERSCRYLEEDLEK